MPNNRSTELVVCMYSCVAQQDVRDFLMGIKLGKLNDQVLVMMFRCSDMTGEL